LKYLKYFLNIFFKIFDILKTDKIKIGNVDRGMNMIKKRLHSRKVLLILDDIDKLDQLQAIVGSRDWFGSGSGIIVTTRDKHVLTVLGADRVYMAREMNDIEALELFSWHAFRTCHPVEDYKELSEQIVDYCGRLPLALEVIGSFLFGRSKVEWKSALEKLRRIPDDQIQKKLQISCRTCAASRRSPTHTQLCVDLENMGRQGILCLLAVKNGNGSRHLVFWSLGTLTGLRDRVRRLVA
jgi:hypothetical protein